MWRGDGAHLHLRVAKDTATAVRDGLKAHKGLRRRRLHFDVRQHGYLAIELEAAVVQIGGDLFRPPFMGFVIRCPLGCWVSIPIRYDDQRGFVPGAVMPERRKEPLMYGRRVLRRRDDIPSRLRKSGLKFDGLWRLLLLHVSGAPPAAFTLIALALPAHCTAAFDEIPTSASLANHANFIHHIGHTVNG